ncbi:PilZ domain-containing protein [Sphingobium sp. CR2-8]|uniref:PilZ domain-containing protein n=1 Tax=Sphingobium sp. CR2-8 TaxID=1306534 RepID=UPI002DB899D1|nr:PilZ domain-containing protein [Sphingobium sp. CR2-8]MEC3910863.1 PilZ domain-containing protein [Sphingobium sp. CR2-8]
MTSSVFAHLDHVLGSRDPAVDQRRARRDLVDMVSHATARGRSQSIRIINISSLGLMCRTDGDLLKGERVSVWLPIVKDYEAEIRWVEGNRVGMEFYTAIEPRIYDAMLSLIPPRRTEW